MWGKFLGVVTVSIATSCAVLTVDVDVYKGPMANESDVQAQQLTAIAVAARPVLIQLRDELETQRRQMTTSTQPTHRQGEEYVFDKELLTSTEARVVNGVLGLYLDKVDPAIAAFVGRGRDIFEDCKRLREQMERFEEDRKLWAKVVPREKDDTYSAFQSLLAPDPSHELNASDRSINGSAKLLGVAAKSATTVFTKLAVIEDVEATLKSLIPDAELRRLVALRVAEIARCYLTGRERLAAGLDLALSFHVALAIHRDRLENVDKITQGSARLISLLIQPQQLALTPRTAGPKSPWLLPNDRQILNVLPPAPSGTDNWSTQNYEKAARALQELLEKQPVEVAGALLRVHRWLREQGSELSIDGRSGADFRFGLARAITLDEGERAEIVEAFQTFRTTIALLGDVGLDGGRLDDGLLTMIGRYLEARDREHVSGDERRLQSTRERRRLMDGLVHLAEKLRFLASHDELIRQTRRRPNAVDGPLNSYVTALESIGNSILTLANEEEHRRSTNVTPESIQTQRAALEALEAVQAALTDLAKSIRPSEDAAANAPAGLSAPADQGTKGATKSNVVSSAPAEADAGRAQFAMQLAAAQRPVNSTAALAAYIRPPWAYLRNSTPVSGLQQGQGPIDNMLTDHAYRAVLGNGYSTALERMASTLDRQFWQNINRVRVAGMGNTSYVLVKDDIGNWYVKGYSADPTPVFEGLQGMALAAQSGAMGMDLFARKDADAKARAESQPAVPAQSATVVGKQARRFEKVYADEAKAESTGAREDHSKFVDEVSKSWEQHSGWEDGGDKPLTRKRKELMQALTNARAEPPAAPADDAKSPVLASDVLAVLAQSLEFQERALALLDATKLVDSAALVAREELLAKSASDLTHARDEVALARAKLEAIKGVGGTLPSEFDRAKSELSDRESKLSTAAKVHDDARTEHDAEAKRVAAARQLVSDLRADVRSIVGGAIRCRLEARRRSSGSYSTALEVLSQSSEPAN